VSGTISPTAAFFEDQYGDTGYLQAFNKDGNELGTRSTLKIERRTDSMRKLHLALPDEAAALANPIRQVKFWGEAGGSSNDTTDRNRLIWDNFKFREECEHLML
jgi:hypothetical protein